MAPLLQHHIHRLGPTLGELDGLEAYAKEAMTTSSGAPTFVRVTSPDLIEAAVLEDPPEHHKLVADASGNLYWWPKWLNLTTRNGLLRSIAANYQRGYGPSEELYGRIVQRVAKELANEKDRRDTISVTTLFENWVLNEIVGQKNSLSPSRTQVISSPDWEVRYLISDEPRLDFVQLKFEQSKPRDHRHPFPLEWILEKFRGIDAPGDIIAPEDNHAAKQLDVLLGKDREMVEEFLGSDKKLMQKALNSLGLDEKVVKPWTSSACLHVLMNALGYPPERTFYYNHFNALATKNTMSSEEMLLIVERRLVEAYFAWIRSFQQILKTDERGFFDYLNEGITQRFQPTKKPTIGTVRKFIETHRTQLERGSQYALWLRSRVPEPMLNLVNGPTEKRIFLLEYMRNDKNHHPSMNSDKYLHDIRLASDFVRWDVKSNWDHFTTKRYVSEFFHGFYGDEVHPCRVPTLMEVTRVELSSHGTSAVLLCLRNGLEHRLRLDENRRIERYDKQGQIIDLQDRDRNHPIEIGQRMYVLPTTNPNLVNPILLHA